LYLNQEPTYEAADQVVKQGLGITAIGIGGDPIIGTTKEAGIVDE
jgi:succinyl-CoA synthetase alpha subunit